MTKAGSKGPRSSQEVVGPSPSSSGEPHEGFPDPDLLAAVRELERGALGEEAAAHIFNAYYARVRRFFASRNVPVEACRDLTQDTFLRVFQGRGKFQCVRKFESWIFQIAANVLRNARRARRAVKRNRPEQSLEEWIDRRGSPPESIEPGSWEHALEELLETERMGHLARELRELPPRMRQCLLLQLRQGLSYPEIARRLDISVGTVKAHLHHGKRRLNERLAAYFGPVDPGNSEETPR